MGSSSRSSSTAAGGSGAPALLAPPQLGCVTRFAAYRKPSVNVVSRGTASIRRRTAAPAAPAQPPVPLLAAVDPRQQIIDEEYTAHRQQQARAAAAEAAETAAAALAAHARAHRVFGAGPLDAALQLADGDYDSASSYYQVSSADVADLADLRSSMLESAMDYSGAELDAELDGVFD
jgi:type IV secretory pathway VirB10-like protein